MTYTKFSLNGQILPIEQAVIPLNSVEYSYGFGVYETIRCTNGILYFIEDHCQRLLNSANIIGLGHIYSAENIQKFIIELVEAESIESCNIKVLLIGGKTNDDANLYIQCLSPLFPDRKLYKTGVYCITKPMERQFPQAKTLNMLSSYLAYRDAKQAGAYDALLVNRANEVTEGTRTNFFTIKDKTLYTPPTNDILLGVTRDKVLSVAIANNFKIVETPISIKTLRDYDGAFLTSTSSKIMPIRSIDDMKWESITPNLLDLIAAFNSYLAGYKQDSLDVMPV